MYEKLSICSLKGKQGPRVCLFKHIFVLFFIFKGDLAKKKKHLYVFESSFGI